MKERIRLWRNTLSAAKAANQTKKSDTSSLAVINVPKMDNNISSPYCVKC